MLFGTPTDEATSFAILDRYVEAGGTFIDTSDNYAFWVDGSQGGESEEAARAGGGAAGASATRSSSRPSSAPDRWPPGTSFADSTTIEGLSAKVIRESAERSRERLGVERLDLLYAHIEDRQCRCRRPSRPSPSWSPRAPSVCWG